MYQHKTLNPIARKVRIVGLNTYSWNLLDTCCVMCMCVCDYPRVINGSRTQLEHSTLRITFACTKKVI